MAFATIINTPSGGNKKEIDYDLMNRTIVEEAGLQDRETLIGVVEIIADLGTQKIPDSEYVFDGDEEEEEKLIAEAKNPGDIYFKNQFDWESKKERRFKFVKQKDQQCVGICVTFPDIIVDKGKWFGESNPQPLRIWMGGSYYLQGTGFILQRPQALKVNKRIDNKNWSLDQKNVLYRMATAAKVIKPGDIFPPQRIDEILGHSFQFECQVYMKPSKDGKEYFHEYVKFAGPLGRGMKAPEFDFTPQLIQFNSDDNDLKTVKELRKPVTNTMAQSSNWEGSKLKTQWESVKQNYDNSEPDEPVENTKTPAKAMKPKKETKPKVAEKDPFDDMDDDVPFN